MINLTRKQQAATFLALSEAWNLDEENKATPGAVRREAIAEIVSYYLPIAATVFGLGNALIKLRHRQADAPHRFWRVDGEELADLVDSDLLASLALRYAGYWRVFDGTGNFEWSDAGGIGGARNELKLPSKLTAFRMT